MSKGSAVKNHEKAEATPPGLSPQEILRYSRHLIMPEVGMEGQLKLKAAKVLLIGAGGLGAPLGLYLAAAGVGRLGLVDFDVVDFTNLQRQVTFGTKDVGRPQLEAGSPPPRRRVPCGPRAGGRPRREAPRERLRPLTPKTQMEVAQALAGSIELG